MTLNEITRVQEYLRLTFSNNRLKILQPKKPDAPIEVYMADEFIGVLGMTRRAKSLTPSISLYWKRIYPLRFNLTALAILIVLY